MKTQMSHFKRFCGSSSVSGQTKDVQSNNQLLEVVEPLFFCSATAAEGQGFFSKVFVRSSGFPSWKSGQENYLHAYSSNYMRLPHQS